MLKHSYPRSRGCGCCGARELPPFLPTLGPLPSAWLPPRRAVVCRRGLRRQPLLLRARRAASRAVRPLHGQLGSCVPSSPLRLPLHPLHRPTHAEAQPCNSNDGATVPSFSHDEASRFTADHGGPAVRAIALRVPDAAEAFRASVEASARPAFAPADLGLGFGFAEVELYGDVVLRFVSHPDDRSEDIFLPGFENAHNSGAPDYGLRRVDHVVASLPEVGPVAKYIAGFTGFHEFVEFTAEEVGTAESGLNIVVLANNTETVLLNLTEPVHGTKRRSQVQNYLDQHGGPGVQHLALASDDVLGTVRGIRAAGGFEFLGPPPPSYYDGVRGRAGDVLSEAQIKECQELGVLVDRDDQGVLIQIFTKPVGDRQTLFLEMIQRIGCMEKDEESKREYQRGAYGGFGKGNFRELFKSVEDYEKSLEAKLPESAAN